MSVDAVTEKEALHQMGMTLCNVLNGTVIPLDAPGLMPVVTPRHRLAVFRLVQWFDSHMREPEAAGAPLHTTCVKATWGVMADPALRESLKIAEAPVRWRATVRVLARLSETKELEPEDVPVFWQRYGRAVNREYQTALAEVFPNLPFGFEQARITHQ